jgi:hypothetical protein
MKEKAILLLRLLKKLETQGLIDKNKVDSNLRPQVMDYIISDLKAGILLH